jgi:hypothetical protein
MNISKSFNFVFEDQQWLSKLGIGIAVMFVPILNFAWVGYIIQLVRNVMDDVAEPLPDWSDFGKKFQDGLMLFIAGFIYGLPMIIPACLVMALSILPALAAGSGSGAEEILTGLMAFGSVVFLCLMCLFFFYGLALSVIYPAIQVMYAREGTLGSCFKLGAIFSIISQNTSSFFTAWLVSIGVNIAASVVLSVVVTVVGWIPCIGQILMLGLSFGTAVVISAISAHLFGQFGALAFGTSAYDAPISVE